MWSIRYSELNFSQGEKIRAEDKERDSGRSWPEENGISLRPAW